jgi:hypothetical protein
MIKRRSTTKLLIRLRFQEPKRNKVRFQAPESKGIFGLCQGLPHQIKVTQIFWQRIRSPRFCRCVDAKNRLATEFFAWLRLLGFNPSGILWYLLTPAFYGNRRPQSKQPLNSSQTITKRFPAENSNRCTNCNGETTSVQVFHSQISPKLQKLWRNKRERTKETTKFL